MKHTKRTTLMVNVQTLEAAQRALGARTYSDTVNQALVQAVRGAQVQNMLNLIGTDAWSGSLTEMRGDSNKKSARSHRARRGKRAS